MTGERFKNLMEEAFSPFLSELGLKLEKPHLSGKYYRARFIGRRYTLIVSFEPGDSYLNTILVQNGKDDLASIDDPQKTPRLSDLNRQFMGDVTPSDRVENEYFFSSINVEDGNEQALLKCAKDLRLVLPRYFKSKK